ncbi:MAG TPA: Ig-like domain-containing protein [Longimicrobium sp.]|nr:Ig-like domain-containing protein [Longimicrobium sp.]
MQLRLLVAVGLAAAAAACGGGGAAPVTGGGGETEALGSVSLTHPEGAAPVGDTMILVVEARDGAGQPVAGIQPTFTSSDPTVATVDAAGVVRGLKAGAATITASVTVGGVTKTATFSVAILASTTPPAGAIAAFALNPATVTLAPGGTAPLETVATDAAGARVTTLPQVAWAVQDGAKARISAGVVTALAAGATTVTASFTADGKTWTASANVIVTAPSTPTAPASATVQGVEDAFSPSAVTIAAGGTVTWTMVDEEHDVTWTGAAPTGGNIGRIDRGRSVSRTFPTAGTYAYTCSRHDGKHGGTVSVQSGGAGETPVLTAVVISPASPSVAVGATLQLTATPLDQGGRTMAGLAAAQWSTANAATATVSATGVVTGVAAGTVGITARITQGGTTREATVNVTVGGTTTPPSPPTTATVTTPGTSFSPAAVTIRAGGTVTWQFTGSTRHNVTFSGTAPTGGNIPDTDAGGTAQRTFATTGTYAYSCTRHSGMNGTVTVQP